MSRSINQRMIIYLPPCSVVLPLCFIWWRIFFYKCMYHTHPCWLPLPSSPRSWNYGDISPYSGSMYFLCVRVVAFVLRRFEWSIHSSLCLCPSLSLSLSLPFSPFLPLFPYLSLSFSLCLSLPPMLRYRPLRIRRKPGALRRPKNVHGDRRDEGGKGGPYRIIIFLVCQIYHCFDRLSPVNNY